MGATSIYRRSIGQESHTAIQFVYTSTTSAQQRAVLANLSGSASLANTPFSLAARFRIDAETSSGQTLFGNFGSSNGFNQYTFFYQNGVLIFDSFRYNSSYGTVRSQLPTPIQLGLWYTVKFVSDGTSIYWYVNGGLVQTQALSFNLTDITDAGEVFSIGGVDDGFGNGFYSAVATLDWLQVEAAGGPLVRLKFNLPSPYRNAGTAGGKLALLGSPVPQFIPV